MEETAVVSCSFQSTRHGGYARSCAYVHAYLAALPLGNASHRSSTACVYNQCRILIGRKAADAYVNRGPMKSDCPSSYQCFRGVLVCI